MYPLKLSPVFRDYIWGGTRLRDDFGKNCDFERIAESWELSCRDDGCSVIENGGFKGKTLREYIDAAGKSVIGSKGAGMEYFPLLIKLIDAKDNLSIQVHPDDDYAKRAEGEYGKTEMWLILDCEPDSELIYGFEREISREEFSRRIKNDTLLDTLKKVPVKKGDVFFIGAGTLHAIGKGILIAEIQQNSNITYRVYDYGRTGADGKPRELHIEKAVEVTKLSPSEDTPVYHIEECGGFKRRLLSECEYFTVYSYFIKSAAAFLAEDDSFNFILMTEGVGVISYAGGEFRAEKGAGIIIPAGMGEYKISGACEFIFIRL